MGVIGNWFNWARLRSRPCYFPDGLCDHSWCLSGRLEAQWIDSHPWDRALHYNLLSRNYNWSPRELSIAKSFFC